MQSRKCSRETSALLKRQLKILYFESFPRASGNGFIIFFEREKSSSTTKTNCLLTLLPESGQGQARQMHFITLQIFTKYAPVRYTSLATYFRINEIVVCVYNSKQNDTKEALTVKIFCPTVMWCLQRFASCQRHQCRLKSTHLRFGASEIK